MHPTMYLLRFLELPESPSEIFNESRQTERRSSSLSIWSLFRNAKRFYVIFCFIVLEMLAVTTAYYHTHREPIQAVCLFKFEILQLAFLTLQNQNIT